jgi:hypothetical protein
MHPLERPFRQPLGTQGVAERVVAAETECMFCIPLHSSPDTEECAVISAFQTQLLVFRQLHGCLLCSDLCSRFSTRSQVSHAKNSRQLI